MGCTLCAVREGDTKNEKKTDNGHYYNGNIIIKFLWKARNK